MQFSFPPVSPGTRSANVHYAIFSGLLVLLVVGHETLAGGWKAMRGRVLGAGAAVIAAAVLVLPFYVPYQLASDLYGMRRGWGEIETFSGRPVDFLTAGPQNKLYGPLTQKLAHPEGDFFPGLSVVALGVIAVVLLWARKPEKSAREGSAERPGRRKLVRILDALVAVLLLLWAAAMLKPNLSIGPLHLGDAGRILVLATPPLLLRLALGFPRGSRFADLGDFLRRRWKERRASVFALVVVLGVVVALGVHTPYYRFLALSFGAIFRAIRVPSRGIVLFDLALGVLAAWGLALVTKRLSRAGKLVVASLVIAAIGFEYRAFPIDIGDVAPEAPPVYGWLASAPFRGAVVHWPLATDPDVEHTFRSAAHWKPIVNGYSGFGPPAYQELVELLAQKPIPPGIWSRLEEAGASVLVFHPLEFADAGARLPYVRALTDGVRSGKAVPLRGFGDGLARDFVFRLSAAAPFDAGLPAGGGPAAADEVRRELSYFESVLHAPFGFIDAPGEGATVAAGAWCYGWALDDSGIREVTHLRRRQGGTIRRLRFGPPGARRGLSSVSRRGEGGIRVRGARSASRPARNRDHAGRQGRRKDRHGSPDRGALTYTSAPFMDTTSIAKIGEKAGAEASVRGWLYNKRSSGKLQFLIVRDGTGYLQCVVPRADVGPRGLGGRGEGLAGMRPGSLRDRSGGQARPGRLRDDRLARRDHGSLRRTIRSRPKEHGVDFLMSQRHLWMRSAQQHAVLRVRSEVEQAIRDFFYERGFTSDRLADPDGLLRRGDLDALRDGLLRREGLPLAVRPALPRAGGGRLRQGLLLRADVPRGEVEDAAPPDGVLDDRAGGGVPRVSGPLRARRGVRRRTRGAGARPLPGRLEAPRARHGEARRCPGSLSADHVPGGDREAPGQRVSR